MQDLMHKRRASLLKLQMAQGADYQTPREPEILDLIPWSCIFS